MDMLSASFLSNLTAAAAGHVALLATAAALLTALTVSRLLHRRPRQTLRQVAWLLTHTLYRVDSTGLADIPRRGGVLLAPNHVSFFDAVLITALCPRPVRFVMDAGIFCHPLLNPVFRAMGCIPIASARRSTAVLARAQRRIAEALEAGEAVCIFPEGALTRDGQLAPFRRGIEHIVARTPVPVVPIALDGLWGSVFSRARRNLRQLFRRGLRPRLHIRSASPIAPHAVRAQALHRVVSAMLTQQNPAAV